MDEERRLWKNLATRESVCPDPNIFAAFIEGRASAEEAANVETHLLGCDACLDAMRLIRSLETETLSVPSARVLERARRLVTPDNIVRRPQRRSPFLKRMATWAALAASLVIACIGGFRLGEDMVVEAGLLRAETARLLDDPLESGL